MSVLRAAFIATATHRESLMKIADYEMILNRILSDTEMNRRWSAYTKQMPYTADISFAATINVARKLIAPVFDTTE